MDNYVPLRCHFFRVKAGTKHLYGRHGDVHICALHILAHFGRDDSRLVLDLLVNLPSEFFIA